MDDLDRRLLALLRKDARLPVASLAAELGVARATVRARMDRMQADGTIRGYTAVLGREAEPAGVRAIMTVEVEGRVADRVARALLGLPAVRTLHSTNGRWDLVAELEAGSLAAFDAALREVRLVDGVARTETSILLATQSRRAGKRSA